MRNKSALLPALLLSLLVSACTGDNGSEELTVSRAPEEGETHFSNIRQLTFGGQNAEAYFSSDGKHLIFQRTVGENSCDQQYTIGTDGSDLRRVSNGLGRTTCGYFYSGDERVLYASTSHVSDSCPPSPDFSQGYVWPLYDFDIYTSNADGSDIKRLTNAAGYDAEATMSPDGQRMIFTSMRDGDLELYTMNVDGSDVVRITHRDGYDGGAFYSRDGKRIVWRAWYPEGDSAVTEYKRLLGDNLVRPSRMELWTANVDGTDARQVTNLGGANFAPYFHPDGKRIIFSSNHLNPTGRDFNIFMINDDGSNLTQITYHNDFDGFPMFSPDGKQLVFASNRHGLVAGETNIFIADWTER